MWRFNAVQQVAIDIYNWLLPLVTINILWFLLSLTVVLMPPATAALYEIAYLAKKGHDPDIRTFLAAIRRWLLKSWLWGAGCLLLVVLAGVALQFYSAQQNPIGNLLLTVTGAILIFIALIEFYHWPYMMAQETPHLVSAVRNAALTVLADPLMPLIYGSIVLLLFVFSVVLIAPIALITPTVVVFLGVYSLLDWLEHHSLLTL